MKVLELQNYKRHPVKISPVIMELLSNYPCLILAGGAIRDSLKGRPIIDYDLFFTDLNYTQRVKEHLVSKGFEITFACPEGKLYSLKHPVHGKAQLICKRSYFGIVDLFSSFDFHICQFSVNHEGVISTTKEAIAGNRKMQLTLNNLEYPSASINRLSKYKDKGFYCGKAIADITQWLVNLSPEDYSSEDDSLYVD